MSFYEKNPEDANMMEYGLWRGISRNGEALKNIFSCMSIYNANITGSKYYFYRRQKELETLINYESLPIVLLNFSTAENYLVDLMKLLNVDNNTWVDWRWAHFLLSTPCLFFFWVIFLAKTIQNFKWIIFLIVDIFPFIQELKL